MTTSTLNIQEPNMNGRPKIPVNTAAEPPVTVDRVLRCLESARYWANELPRYANQLQRRADGWSIAAGLLSAVTGVAIWTVVVNNDDIWSTAAASVLALASAGCALVPRIKSNGEMAGQARELAARYGACLGQLTDAHAWMTTKTADNTVVRQIVGTFESVKASKDSLRALPERPAAQACQHPELLAEVTFPPTQEPRKREMQPTPPPADCPLVTFARLTSAADQHSTNSITPVQAGKGESS